MLKIARSTGEFCSASPEADNSLGNSLVPYVAIEQKYLFVVLSDDKGSRVSLGERGEGRHALATHHKHCK